MRLFVSAFLKAASFLVLVSSKRSAALRFRNEGWIRFRAWRICFPCAALETSFLSLRFLIRIYGCHHGNIEVADENRDIRFTKSGVH